MIRKIEADPRFVKKMQDLSSVLDATDSEIKKYLSERDIEVRKVHKRYEEILRALRKKMTRLELDVSDLFDEVKAEDLNLTDSRVSWSEESGCFVVIDDDSFGDMKGGSSPMVRDFLSLFPSHLRRMFSVSFSTGDDSFDEDDDDDDLSDSGYGDLPGDDD